jgi:membrane-associated protein
MVHAVLDFLRALTDPERLIQLLSGFMGGWVGYALLFVIVFSETGLLVGFFLPGDSLLFTVGVVAGAGNLNIFIVNLVLMAAAMIGDSTGYWIGRGTGLRLFNRPDSRVFKRDHVIRTQRFYEKHGGKTIIYARFVPIIRTFAAFVAGVAEMPYLRFLPFSVCGAAGWVAFMTVLGYKLGEVPLVRHHFEKVVALIIVISLLPAISEAIKARRRPAAEG